MTFRSQSNFTPFGPARLTIFPLTFAAPWGKRSSRTDFTLTAVSTLRRLGGRLLICQLFVLSCDTEVDADLPRPQQRKAHSASYGHGQDLQSFNLRGKVSVVTGANSGGPRTLTPCCQQIRIACRSGNNIWLGCNTVSMSCSEQCLSQLGQSYIPTFFSSVWPGGIGREIAEFLVAHGSRVYMAARLT